MSEKESTAKQSGPGVVGAPTSVPSPKAPTTGAQSLKPVIQPDTKAVKG